MTNYKYLANNDKYWQISSLFPIDVDLVEGCFSIVTQAGVEFDSLKLIHFICLRAPTPTTLVLILIFSTKIFMNCCIVEL